MYECATFGTQKSKVLLGILVDLLAIMAPKMSCGCDLPWLMIRLGMILANISYVGDYGGPEGESSS